MLINVCTFSPSLRTTRKRRLQRLRPNSCCVRRKFAPLRGVLAACALPRCESVPASRAANRACELLLYLGSSSPASATRRGVFFSRNQHTFFPIRFDKVLKNGFEILCKIVCKYIEFQQYLGFQASLTNFRKDVDQQLHTSIFVKLQRKSAQNSPNRCNMILNTAHCEFGAVQKYQYRLVDLEKEEAAK